jgi:hypothetical protein
MYTLTGRVLIAKAKTGAAYHRDFDNDDGLFSVEDVPPGKYDLSFRSLPFNSQSPLVVLKSLVEGIEIKRGYYYGEITVRLLPDRDR